MKINWSEKEAGILSKMDIPFDFKSDLSDEKIGDLYEMVPDYMFGNTDTGDDRPDSDCNICEDIITKLAKAMEPHGLLA